MYSSRPAIVKMYVREQDIPILPETLRKHVGPPEPLSDLCQVNLDAWSFETQWCPMYPQERYRLGVILALTESAGATVHSSPDRWTGERTETEVWPSDATQRFWVNMRRRGEFGPNPLD